jgi:hypothetical protein
MLIRVLAASMVIGLSSNAVAQPPGAGDVTRSLEGGVHLIGGFPGGGGLAIHLRPLPLLEVAGEFSTWLIWWQAAGEIGVGLDLFEPPPGAGGWAFSLVPAVGYEGNFIVPGMGTFSGPRGRLKARLSHQYASGSSLMFTVAAGATYTTAASGVDGVRPLVPHAQLAIGWGW